MAGTALGQAKQAAARCGLPLDEWQRRRAAGLARCYACTEWKPSDEFAKDASRPTGRASICKPCARRASVRSIYGITEEDLKSLPGADGNCPICDRFGELMHVDHDHDSGKVRGFLCARCNVGLGLFLDSREMLAKATAYLEKHDE